MSMTAEQRKEWAYGILDRYRRDVEIAEFLDALDESASGVQETLDGIERDLSTHGDMIQDLDAENDRLRELVADLGSRVEDLEGWQEEQTA